MSEGRVRGREVWITGMGMLTPLGGDLPPTWEGIRRGRCGIRRHPGAGAGAVPENLLFYGGVEGFEDPPEHPPRLASQRKFLNRGSMLGLHAAEKAVRSAGVDLSAYPPERKALYVASGDFSRLGHLDFYSAFKSTAGGDWKMPDAGALNEAALHQVNPFFLLEGLANNLFSFLSALYEVMGPNGSFSSLSSTGAQAVEYCDRVLRQGEADVGIAVGCGSWVARLVMFEMAELGMLSKAAEGAASYRPFDRRRDGFLAGEGAAALLLEAAETAAARGAKPLGRILGTGNCHEIPEDYLLPVPTEAIRRACAIALAEAGLSLSDLSFILPHGSGTPKGDRNEMRALREITRDADGRVPISCLKAYTGHMAAASDVGEIIVGLRALEEGFLPSSLGFEEAEEEFASLEVVAPGRPVSGRVFLSLSNGLGGQSSATVVGAP